MLYALIITILVESIVAFVAGLRKKEELLAILCINVMTNPPLNYFLWLCYDYGLLRVDTTLILSLEAIVVLIEWRLLVYVFGRPSRKMLLLSLLMNFCSYAAGLLIF
jgi:hypothetical protein